MSLDFLRAREVTNVVRFFLDDCLPPVLRDNRMLMGLIARLYCGSTYSKFDLDFKMRALRMSDAEMAKVYENAPGCGDRRVRDTDLTRAEIEYVLSHVRGNRILELGCGAGVLSLALARRYSDVTSTDVHSSITLKLDARSRQEGISLLTGVAVAEHLPFEDKSFETVVAAHTLEHVRHFEQAVKEMVRVARDRIVIVIPRQRYYRYTVDYHLHFFPDCQQLILRVGLPHYQCEVITGDICYTGHVS